MIFQVLFADQPLCNNCHFEHDPILECPGLTPVPPSPRCLHCEICHFTDECPTPCTSPLPCLLKPYSTEKWVCEDCARKNRTSPTDHVLHSGSRKSYFIPRCPTANTNGWIRIPTNQRYTSFFSPLTTAPSPKWCQPRWTLCNANSRFVVIYIYIHIHWQHI